MGSGSNSLGKGVRTPAPPPSLNPLLIESMIEFKISVKIKKIFRISLNFVQNLSFFDSIEFQSKPAFMSLLKHVIQIICLIGR